MAGLSKGGLGGAGLASTPLLALVVAPSQAAAIMLPVLCVLDLFGIRAYWRRWDPRVLKIIVFSGMAGCVLGALTFRHVDENWLRLLVGSIALGFIAFSLWPKKPAKPPSDAKGYFWSTVAGFTSFITHAGSPPLMVYLLPLRLEKATFVSTVLVFLAAINYVKILPYFWLGLLDTRNLGTSLVLAPLGVVAIYAGLRLQQRISAQWFYRVIYVVLGMSGVKLLYDGVSALAG